MDYLMKMGSVGHALKAHLVKARRASCNLADSQVKDGLESDKCYEITN